MTELKSYLNTRVRSEYFYGYRMVNETNALHMNPEFAGYFEILIKADYLTLIALDHTAIVNAVVTIFAMFSA